MNWYLDRLKDGEKNWALLRVATYPEVGSHEIGLRRHYLVKTPLFGIYLHEMYNRDPLGAALHDHQWNFLSVVLRGRGYWERLAGTNLVWHRWMRPRFRQAEVPHSIIALERTPTWTLCIVGRNKHKWGRYEPTGWEPGFRRNGRQQ